MHILKKQKKQNTITKLQNSLVNKYVCYCDVLMYYNDLYILPPPTNQEKSSLTSMQSLNKKKICCVRGHLTLLSVYLIQTTHSIIQC